MKKIIIASIVLLIINYSLGTLYCRTFDISQWGDGSTLFFWTGNVTGIIAIIGYINESYKNASHWLGVAFICSTWAYMIAQILFPALTR